MDEEKQKTTMEKEKPRENLRSAITELKDIQEEVKKLCAALDDLRNNKVASKEIGPYHIVIWEELIYLNKRLRKIDEFLQNFDDLLQLKAENEETRQRLLDLEPLIVQRGGYRYIA